MKRIFWLALSVMGTAALYSCGGAGKSNKDKDGKDSTQQDTTATVTPKVPIDTFLTDAARFIAGVPTLKHFKDSVNYPIWEKHSKATQEMYAYLRKDKLDSIRMWINRENLKATGLNQSLFYPFAGADFVYANAFFPYAEDYTLLALEPAGSLPDYDKMSASEKTKYLSSIYNSTLTSNEYGFFRTNSMQVDFKQKDVNGTLHTILFYMALTGHDIISLKHFTLDSITGQPVYTEPVKGKKLPYGVEIGFTDSLHAKARKVYYMSYDIWDPNLEKKMELFKFLDSLDNFSVFMKAASCLCAYTGYDKVRSYMLNNADYFLQDDSGMPYRYLTPNYDVTLYGKFTKVIPLFHNYNQPDLAEAYRNDPTKRPLPFVIGYGGEKGESNIQYGVRKSDKPKGAPEK